MGFALWRLRITPQRGSIAADLSFVKGARSGGRASSKTLHWRLVQFSAGGYQARYYLETDAVPTFKGRDIALPPLFG